MRRRAADLMRLAGLFGHQVHVFMRAGERITRPFRLRALGRARRPTT